jgi:septum formation protein
MASFYIEGMGRLILASASPRRRELLRQAGFTFAVRAADVDESVRPGEDPVEYVTRLAREKAQAVYRELMANPRSPKPGDLGHPAAEGTGNGDQGSEDGIVVLGADTTVTLDGEILGKPVDKADAARMLRALSGRTHRVITGVAVVSARGVEAAAEVTVVRFHALSDSEIAGYVETGEPMDKAGAYAIQGRAAKWIPRIEGCYFNVVGLPLALVATMLEEHCGGTGE